MEEKDLEKALEIVSRLMNGEPVSREDKASLSLYEEYEENGQIYEYVNLILKKLNLTLYEYNYSLYITPGENNKIFGYSNEELKRELGVKLNRELYLCYFIIYGIITKFYKNSAVSTYTEYVKVEDVIETVDSLLASFIRELDAFDMEEIEENSFKTIAMVWEDMPALTVIEGNLRAARNSKAGFVKMVFNFLEAQGLLLENEKRYYMTQRMSALVTNYFEEYKGRIYEIMKGESQDGEY